MEVVECQKIERSATKHCFLEVAWPSQSPAHHSCDELYKKKKDVGEEGRHQEREREQRGDGGENDHRCLFLHYQK